jgi:enoyl-CoA hydratase
MRNSPEAHEFIEHAAEHGVPSAVAERDARFGDYSQAPSDGRPDPSHVIEP